jgi:hypothetical protein
MGRWLVCQSSWPEVLLAAKTYGSVFYDKLSPSIARGEVVGPVRNHVTMKQWGDVSQVFIGNGHARLRIALVSPPHGYSARDVFYAL